MTRYLLACAATLATAGCDEEAPFETNASFKDDIRNRVFVIQATEPVSTEQVAEYAETIAHTDGQFTVAFIYEAGGDTPADLVTLNTDYLAAINAMYDTPAVPPWRWRYSRNPAGNSHLVDCAFEPRDDLCET